jgi:hypothetical protein
MRDVSSRTKGARQCTNPECEYNGRWLVRTMTRTLNGRWLCLGRGCHTMYDANEVIDAESEDWLLWVDSNR